MPQCANSAKHSKFRLPYFTFEKDLLSLFLQCNVLRLYGKVMLKGAAAAEGSREEENTNSACGAFFGGGSGDLGNVL